MTLTLAMIAAAWLIPLTPLRRIVPSESVIALLAVSAVVLGSYAFGLLE